MTRLDQVRDFTGRRLDRSMPTLDGEHYVGSLLENVPFIADIESRADTTKLGRWQADYWWLSVVASAIYLVVLYTGNNFMKHREPYVLRKPLFLWNVGLAVFSILGALSVVPNLVHLFYRKGFIVSSCRTMVYHNPALSVWTILFALSKIVEFGDTFFLVVRKSRVPFLHWYHHITALMYSWYGLGGQQASGLWFGGMNYAVHSVMYSYFAVHSAGRRVPTWISKTITILQISQMFMGLAVNLAVYVALRRGQECEVNLTYFSTGMLMYGTYAVLFIQFFYTKYIK